MAFLDSGEPFGLPKGTIRGVITLAITATFIQQVLVGAITPEVFIGIAGTVIGSYFVTRNAEPLAQPGEEPVSPPSIGSDRE